jgi:hypothetical protein
MSLVLLGLVLALWAGLWRDRTELAAGAAPTEAPSARQASHPPLPARGERPVALNSLAAPASAAPLRTVKANMAESDWRAFDREWCDAAAPHRQAMQGANGRLEDLPTDGAALDDSVLTELGNQLLQRTARALAARASPRERAVGLWLAGRDDELLAEAEARQDPVIAALAAQRLREPLRGRAIRLWRSLEPANMAALMHAQSVDPLPTEQWLDTLLRTTTYQTHITTVFDIALSVPPPTAGSPSELALQLALAGLHDAFPIPDLRALTLPCRQPQANALARQCALFADRLWALQPNDSLMPRLAVALVRAQPALHAEWQQRARQVEAVSQREIESLEARLTALTQRLLCLPATQAQGVMDERLRQGNWVFWSAQVPKDPAELTALSERFRASNKGKGLLTPR